MLAGRIRQASPAARETAELAAAIGRDFPRSCSPRPATLDGAAVAAAVDELWRRRITASSPRLGYDLHDLLREEARTPRSARPGGGRCTAGWRRRWRRCTTATRPPRRPSRITMSGPNARPGPCHTTSARRRRPARCSPTRRPSGTTAAQRPCPAAPACRRRDSTELAIRNAMAAPLNAQHGYASTELQAVFERAGELAGQLGDTRVQLLGLVGLFAVRYVQGHIGESHDIACRALALSPRHPDLAGQAHFAVAGSATSLGQHKSRCRTSSWPMSGARTSRRAGRHPHQVHARGWSAMCCGWSGVGGGPVLVRLGDRPGQRGGSSVQPRGRAVRRGDHPPASRRRAADPGVPPGPGALHPR